MRRARAGFRWKHVSAERPARKRRAGRQIYYVRTDHIGRPVFATNDLGVKVWEAAYLPFGGVHIATGGIDLRFPGQWFQTESGLHQNWMRDYDPTTGRYIQADPLGLVDGASVYGYALQNPGRYVDPRGEQGLDGLLSSSVGRGAMSVASGAALADGPLPFGDAVAACVIVGAAIYCAAGGALCTVADDEAARCEAVRQVCHRNCVDYFEEGPFPVWDQQAGYRRCMRECMAARDCPF